MKFIVLSAEIGVPKLSLTAILTLPELFSSLIFRVTPESAPTAIPDFRARVLSSAAKRVRTVSPAMKISLDIPS